MTLSLPEDLATFADDIEQMHAPSVYALTLERPDNLASAWDHAYNVRPSWFPELLDAERVVYVGATSDTLNRLEDHRDGQVRTTTLTDVCTITGLRNVWWFQDADRAFEREYGIAAALSQEYPELYVHQR